MKMSQIPLLEAQPDQIKLYATDFLGLDLEPGDTEQTIFAKVDGAMPGDDPATKLIFVPEDIAAFTQEGSAPLPAAGSKEVAPPPGQRLAGGLGRDDPKVTLTVNNEERDGEVYSRDKEVGVNGVVWLLQRGKRITVPYRVFMALEVAVRDSITHDKETGEEHHTLVSAVPYAVHSLPSDEEIAAWRERTDNVFCP